MSGESSLSNLPGYELYRDGMMALQKGDFNTAPAQLLLVARIRLSQAGLPILSPTQSVPAHLAFFGLLANQYPDPHFRYNACLQRLDKFCRAVEREYYSRAP